MKTCTKCGIPKEEADFYLRKKSGKPSQPCKECVCAQSAKRRRDNPEECKKSYNKWREKDPEKARKWYKKDPEAVKKKQREEYWKDPEKARRENRESRARNPGYWVRYKYKMSLEEWDERILNQGGMCAICEESTKLCVDHDHVSGVIRGLLCRSCNIALGKFKESSKIVCLAAEYMKKFSPAS